MKPYLILIPAPTTHTNPRLPFKILPSGKKEAVIYFESLADATEFIQTENLFDPSLAFHLMPATPATLQKHGTPSHWPTYE